MIFSMVIVRKTTHNIVQSVLVLLSIVFLFGCSNATTHTATKIVSSNGEAVKQKSSALSENKDDDLAVLHDPKKTLTRESNFFYGNKNSSFEVQNYDVFSASGLTTRNGPAVCVFTNTAQAKHQSRDVFITYEIRIFEDRDKQNRLPTIRVSAAITDGDFFDSSKREPAIVSFYLENSHNVLLEPDLFYSEFGSKSLEIKKYYQPTHLGAYSEFINSIREVASFVYSASLLNPDFTSESSDLVMTLGFGVVVQTSNRNFVSRMAVEPVEFLKFVECAEPLIKKVQKNIFFQTFVKEPPTFLECVTRQTSPPLVYQWSLGLESHSATLHVNGKLIEYGYAQHSLLKNPDNLKLFNSRKNRRRVVFRFSDLTKSQAEKYDRAFGGYSPYERFDSVLFLRDENGEWEALTTNRDNNYQGNVIKMTCTNQNREWWDILTSKSG